MFVMLQRIFDKQWGVLLCRQWCLVTKKSWAMKLLVKHYLAINQRMKGINGDAGVHMCQVLSISFSPLHDVADFCTLWLLSTSHLCGQANVLSRSDYNSHQLLPSHRSINYSS